MYDKQVYSLKNQKTVPRVSDTIAQKLPVSLRV